MVIPNLKFSEMGGYSGVNFGHPKSEVFQNGGGYSRVTLVIPNLKFSEMGGWGLSGLQFQKGAFWKIWTKIYCAARNLLVHHSSLSHTTYMETNQLIGHLFIIKQPECFPKTTGTPHSMNSMTKLTPNKPAINHQENMTEINQFCLHIWQ